MTSGKKTTSAVGRAFDVLRVLRGAPVPMQLTTIAESVGIAASSAHSVLLQLCAEGAVSQDAEKRYQLGPALFYLGSAFARGASLYRATWVELVNAANEMGVTTAIAVPWDEHHLVLNAHRGGTSDVTVPFGGRVPIDGGSFGKVYYAYSGVPTPPKIRQFTDASVTDPDEFAKQLTQTRQAGYASDIGEFADGVGAVCAPVTSSEGYEGLAAFLGPLDRFEELQFTALGRRLANLTARASHTLGATDRVRFFGSE